MLPMRYLSLFALISHGLTGSSPGGFVEAKKGKPKGKHEEGQGPEKHEEGGKTSDAEPKNAKEKPKKEILLLAKGVTPIGRTQILDKIASFRKASDSSFPSLEKAWLFVSQHTAALEKEKKTTTDAKKELATLDKICTGALHRTNTDNLNEKHNAFFFYSIIHKLHESQRALLRRQCEEKSKKSGEKTSEISSDGEVVAASEISSCADEALQKVFGEKLCAPKNVPSLKKLDEALGQTYKPNWLELYHAVAALSLAPKAKKKKAKFTQIFGA
jgi:hypothetical protein